MFILDTSILIELLHGTQIGRQISEEIKEEVATTVFSIYEIKKGERKNEAEIIDLFLSNIKVIDFGVLAARESSKIEKELSEKGKLINRVNNFIFLSFPYTRISRNKSYLCGARERFLARILGRFVLVESCH